MIKYLSICICFLWSMHLHAGTNVNVVGLFSGKAVVMINGGAPQTLSVGQTKEGVKLIAADSQKAKLRIEGKIKVVSMGQAAIVAGDTPRSSGRQTTQLYADSTGHFFGSLTVNHTPLKYVVDTGATTVALSSVAAKRAGIDYKKGNKMRVSTASGMAKAYLIKINTLKIGGITLHNVEASVVQGSFPQIVLLGMTALNRLDMKRENAVMTLTKKY